MREPEQRYRQITQDVMWERVQRKVSQDEEASYTEQLEQCWFEMTEDEREAAEAWFAELRRRQAPALLPFVDPSTADVTRRLPRIHR